MMKALRGRWFLLFLAAAAWTQDVQVSVTCGQARFSVAVPAALLGSNVASGELVLGSGCGVTSLEEDRYLLEHPFVSCGTTLELLPDSIHYSNVLHYHPSSRGPVARARSFSLPVDCSYPRMGSVSSGALQPNWIPVGFTIAPRRRLRFALDVYDSSWSSHLPQPPTYSLGELINIEASVATHPQLPLKVFVDQCGVSPGVAAPLKYEVITDDGCLLDGQLGRSRFLPQQGGGFLRFQLDTFLFPNASGSQIYLHCQLKAVAQGAGGTLGRACSYDRLAGAWRSLDGADCSCCASPPGCGGHRQRRSADTAGLLGEAHVLLGPLQLLSALPSSSPGMTLEATTASPPRPSVPVVQGEKRDSGPALPVAATTLAMVAMVSILVAVGMVGCYCSVRRHRLEAVEAAPGEPRAVAMAPTTSATPRTLPAPAAPAVV